MNNPPPPDPTSSSSPSLPPHLCYPRTRCWGWAPGRGWKGTASSRPSPPPASGRRGACRPGRSVDAERAEKMSHGGKEMKRKVMMRVERVRDVMVTNGSDDGNYGGTDNEDEKEVTTTTATTSILNKDDEEV